jgi:DNA-binding transcriptional MerR regulator
MTVIELAKLVGVTPDVIRYYARIGLLKPKRNPANNYKQFSPADVKHVQFIRRAQRLGFALVEIAALPDGAGDYSAAYRRKKPRPEGSDCLAEQDEERTGSMEKPAGWNSRRSCDMPTYRSGRGCLTCAMPACFLISRIQL